MLLAKAKRHADREARVIAQAPYDHAAPNGILRGFRNFIDQARLALKNDPTDQSALYQEIQAQRRLGNKEAIQPLVSRLEELKRREQVTRAQYLLEDANTNRSSP